MARILAVALLTMLLNQSNVKACSMFYYIDKTTGKIYVANNEDYWYGVKTYIQVIPKSKDEHARLWYGWDNFAQGGINELGLFFDGAVTPKQNIPEGYHDPKGRNLSDEILSKCKTDDEAVGYLEIERIAIPEGHLMVGDKTGNAVVMEWVNGEKKLYELRANCYQFFAIRYEFWKLPLL